jgi:tocopherol O-methyltransferase
MNNELIKDYYNYTLKCYRIFYHRDSNAVHYGFWDKSTKNHKEALINVNKFLAEILKIKSGDTILDAGCGIGGSAIWLAKHFHVNVVGITISDRQYNEAKILSEKNNVPNKTKFYIRDYTNTYFDDGSFSVVWAIESICYADNKIEFLKEAYRLLKEGGRIIINDVFLLRKNKGLQEKIFYDLFLNGFVISNLSFASDFKKSLKEVGFKDIKIYDKASATLYSSKKIYKMSIFSWPLSIITEKIGLTNCLLTKNNLAGIVQYPLFKNKLIGHRVFYAEKK